MYPAANAFLKLLVFILLALTLYADKMHFFMMACTCFLGLIAANSIDKGDR